MKDLEELKAIKKRMQCRMGIRKPGEAKMKIVVGFADVDVAAGAPAVVRAFIGSLDKSGVFDVAVIQDGERSFEGCAPGADVYSGDGGRVSYANLTPEKAARIVAEHIVGGCAVAEYAVPAGE